MSGQCLSVTLLITKVEGGRVRQEEKTTIVLYLVNAPEYFVSHRRAIAKEAQARGAKVHVVSNIGGQADKVAVEVIHQDGFIYHDIPMYRGSQNPFFEIRAVVSIYSLLKKIQPDLVHLVTIKPVLYGGLAARLARVPAIIAAVAGLGTIFLNSSLFAKFRRWGVSRLLRYALRFNRVQVIFQNPDDRDVLVLLGVILPEQASLIRGSGVSLELYPYLPERDDVPVVIMAARLLKEKGVSDFIEAARLLHERGVYVEFRLAGLPDPGNPSSVTDRELTFWGRQGYVRLLGHCSDIADQYTYAHIVCLPSYREGLPKSLVEAAACGRAVVTTNVPGCRDAILPGVSGLLVPPKSPAALADAIQLLTENSPVRKAMGAAGRDFAEKEFDIKIIVRQHIDIYKKFLGSKL